MPDGAIDNDFDEAEKPPAERLAESFKDTVGDIPTHRDLEGGDLAIDLVTRQVLLIRGRAADTIVDYYDEQDFDLAGYKQHPWLPVRSDDPVFECIFVTSTAESLHSGGKTYDYPAGRLARIPTELQGKGD